MIMASCLLYCHAHSDEKRVASFLGLFRLFKGDSIVSAFKDDLQDLQRLVCRKLLEEIRKDRPGGQDIPPALIGRRFIFRDESRRRPI